MISINASQSLTHAAATSRFDSDRILAISIAERDSELIEPELVAWIDRCAGRASPVLEGCAGPDGWHDYGVSHGGLLEVDVDGQSAFIFAESSPFDGYAHFGPGPLRNLHDAQGSESICQVGGKACVPLDEWTSKLT